MAAAAIFEAHAVLDSELERPSTFAIGVRGEPADEVTEKTAKRFKSQYAPRLRWDVLAAADEHRAAGRPIVLVATGARPEVEPLAAALKADHVVCTELEAAGGKLTGRVEGVAAFGASKVERLGELDIDLAESWAYASACEDVPLLEAAGHPIVVAPFDGLDELAAARGWPVVEPAPPPGESADLSRMVRSAGFWGGMVAGMGAGVALSALNRSREPLVDVGLTSGAALALAAAGIRIEIEGREHLFSSRPCVFTFNHQSLLDGALAIAIIEGGYTGVGKAELKKWPIFGQFFQLAGLAFVSREGGGRDDNVLEPAIAKVRDDRISLVIAPEGTRQPTPRLGRFKTGAVRIAQEGDVPVVPIVLHNAGALMARASTSIRPGVAYITVLEPVDVTGEPREQTDRLRDLFEAALDAGFGAGASD